MDSALLLDRAPGIISLILPFSPSPRPHQLLMQAENRRPPLDPNICRCLVTHNNQMYLPGADQSFPKTQSCGHNPYSFLPRGTGASVCGRKGGSDFGHPRTDFQCVVCCHYELLDFRLHISLLDSAGFDVSRPKTAQPFLRLALNA